MKSFEQTPFTALVITLSSLFCQWVNWFAYEKINFDWSYTLFTPLILCLMYHLVQMEAGKNGNFSRKFFFIFSALIPFIFSVILFLVVFLLNPDISVFNAEIQYTGTIIENIATYLGRFCFTSLYLIVFALVDIPLLMLTEKFKEKKQ